MSFDEALPPLVTPEGWLVDPLGHLRLVRQLDRMPEWVCGVVAPGGPLVAGASYRCHAERRALRPLSDVTEIPAGNPVEGAALLRPGVSHHIDGSVLRVEGGPLVVDHGTHAHDPWRPSGTLTEANVLALPPFPVKPVVAFLGVERDIDVADWARRIANQLLRRGIDARLLVPQLADGLNLTMPCLPTATSLRSVGTDVVIALDPTAARRAASWLDDRTTTIVELAHGAPQPVELVSWRIGEAQGRLRARVSDRVRPDALVPLVHRLCAGPQPIAPSDVATIGGEGEAPVAVRTAVRADHRRFVVVHGVLDTAASQRVAALTDQLAATGATVSALSWSDGSSDEIISADAVLLRSLADAPGITALVDQRSRASRPTAVDLGAADLVIADEIELTESAERLLRATGRATAPSPVLRDLATRVGARSHLLGTILGCEEIAALRHARKNAHDDGVDTIGWHTGHLHDSTNPAVTTVADAVLEVLEAFPNLHLEVVGSPDTVPPTVLGHRRVTLANREVDPAHMARWRFQLWTPPPVEIEALGNISGFLTPSYVGAPTLCSVRDAAMVGGSLLCDTTVDRVERVDDWTDLMLVLLNEEPAGQAQRRTAIMRRTQALYGPEAMALVVRRLLGWFVHDPASDNPESV